MSRRTRVPGPIAQDQTLGNSGERVPPGVSKWISIDVNDGSWTLYDPDSTLISSTTTASGMRIELDEAENNHRWNTGTQNMYRYYRRLKGPDGQFLTWSDFFSVDICVRLETNHTSNSDGTAGSCDHHGVMVGVADESVTNQTSGIEWAGGGGLMHFDDTDNLRLVLGGHTNTVVDNDVNTAKGVFHVSSPFDESDADGNPSTRHVYGFSLNSSDQITRTGGQADAPRANVQSFEYDGTEPVYLFFAGNYGTTTNLGNIVNPDATWQAWYRVNHSRDRVAPAYIPGGGVSG